MPPKYSQLVFVLLLPIVLNACQTASRQEERLILTSGIFPPSSINAPVVDKEGIGSQEYITAYENGRYTGVSFNKAGAGYVFSRGKTLSIRSLRAWSKFKEADLQFGQENNIRTPLGNISYVRFQHSKNQCFFFRHLFLLSSQDDGGRYSRVLSGYFCEADNLELKDSLISDFLHQVGVTGHYEPKPVLTSSVSSRSEIRETRPSYISEDLSTKTDKIICSFALASNRSEWETGWPWFNYAREAQRRSLTPEHCTKHIK